MLNVVTGGAGHLGTNLAADLLAAGQRVRVVDWRRPTTAIRLGAEWVDADVRDIVAMRRAFEGAVTVYHLAAIISVAGGRRGLVESVNVDGVRVVAHAALSAGVPRLVHCSSIHAFDLAGGGTIDERYPRATGRGLPAYDRSKAAGEVELRRVVERGLDAVVVNPTGVIGPVDEAPSRMGTVLRALWRRRLPALVPGGFDWVDVRDVVAAMRAAADRGRTGESYLLPGHRRSATELAVLAAECSGIPVTRRTVPGWTVRACAPVASVIARAVPHPLLPTGEALRALREFPVVDGRKAATELGHRPRPIAETITALFEYFRAVRPLGSHSD
jgi:dihydroflavonol-4-reductase